MAARKKNRNIFSGLEKTTTLLRFAGALAGIYFLYHKYQQSQDEQQAQQQAVAEAASMASAGATKPMTAAGVKILPSSGASPVAYQGASPDQVDTTRKLSAPQAQSLDPNEVAAKALTDLVSRYAS